MILFFVLILSNSSFSQYFYHRLYGDTCVNKGYSIYLDKDSTFIMTGYTCNNTTGTNDVYLIHTKLDGGLIWSKAIEILGEEQGYSVIENFDTSGNPVYIVTGDTRSSHLGSSTDAFLMETDQFGVPNWVETFSRSTRPDHGRCVIKTVDKSYLVAGFSNTCDSSYQDTCVNCHDVFLFKTDFAGNLLWANYIDIASGDDYGYKVIETERKYYVTGFTRLTNCTNTDIFLMQVDPNGTVDWVKTYGDSLGDFSYSLVATPDTGLIMVGHTFNYSATAVPDVHVIKTNLNGVPQWKTTYNTLPNNEQNFGRDIVVTKEGYYITGYSDVIVASDFDMHLIKIKLNGNMAWQRAYGDSLDEKSFSLVNLNNGAAMLGYTNSYGSGFDDVYLVRTDINGISCEIPLDTNQTFIDTLYKTPHFYVDSEYVYENVHFEYDPRYDVDSFCYDTSQSHRFAIFNNLFPGDKLTIYPNPISVNGTLRIELVSDKEDNYTVEIFNQLGTRLIHYEDKSAKNVHEYILSASKLAAGIYTVRVNGYMIRRFAVGH